MDAPPETPIERPRSGWLFLRALRATISRPTIWLFVWAVTAVLALGPAAAYHGWLRTAVANRYEPGKLAHTLDQSLDRERPETSFRADFAEELSLLEEATAGLGAALAFFMLLFGVFSAGGWLQIVLERTRVHALRRFLFGGARYFWRFFRVMLISLLLLGFFGWIVYGTPFQEHVLQRRFGLPSFDLDSLENLESEWTYVRVTALQASIYGLLFGLVLTFADYTRTRLALHNTRSVVAASLRTFFTMLRHPIRTLRPMLLLLLVELTVIVAGGLLLGWLERGLGRDPTQFRVLAILGVAQLVFLWRIITRGARYQVAAVVTAEIARPPAQPDPWRSSIGGPGGPRYPLEGSDEYGVSL